MKYWLYFLSVAALVAAGLSMVLRVPEGRSPFQVFEERISDAVVKEERVSQELEMKLFESVAVLKASLDSRSDRNNRADGFAFVAMAGLSVLLFVTAFLTPPKYVGRNQKRSPN